MSRTVVVTGCGAVTAAGSGVESLWSSLYNKTTLAGPITEFDASAYPQCPNAAYEAPIDPTDHDLVNAQRMGRYTQLAMLAAEEALDNAEIDPASEQWDPESVGVSVGSGIGGVPSTERGSLDLDSEGRLSPTFMLRVLPNLAAGQISIAFGAGGPNRSQSTACAAGSHSIADAVDDIRLGRADVMIAGGAESAITPTGIAGFGAMRALSTNDADPTAASRPFDANRDGFVMGEGAGMLVLEAKDHAIERGAEPLAEISGLGITADASHPTRPHADGWGLKRAMQNALQDADRESTAVDLITAHATSTPHGDAHEADAIQSVFDHPVAVTAPKSAIGHTLGASGAIESVLSVRSLTESVLPPTLNYDTPDEDCDVEVVTEPTEATVQTVMNNAAGFGGKNVVLLFETP